MTNMLSVSAQTLHDQLEGQVLLAGDDGYDEARTVWNGMIDRRPDVIVRCASVADVVAGVRFARDNGMDIGIRCGGHSVTGLAVPDGGLMLDLTPLGQVRVDPQRRRAVVQGGALLGALDQASQPHGLATTAGNVSHTGVGGLTLGGGMGWLARQYGLTCDNVLSFELVTAAGEVLRVTADEHPDLFWALRGGGGNFGVVTEFEFALHESGTQAVVAEFFHPLDEAVDALRGWRELNTTAPRAATLTAWVGDAGEWPYLPAELHGRPLVGIGAVLAGDVGSAEGVLADLRAVGRPVAERLDRMTYLQLQTMDDTWQQHDVRRYWKGHFLKQLPDAALEAFVLRGTPDGHGDGLPAASMQAYGGAIADVPDDATAFSHRNTQFEFVTATKWTDPADDEPRMTAARTYGRAIEPFASGAYVNSLSDDGQDGVQRAYSAAKLARLTAVKDAYDPDNVFRLNHNIPPSGR